MHIQPDEAIWLNLETKEPGLQNNLLHPYLDLTYSSRGFPVKYDGILFSLEFFFEFSTWLCTLFVVILHVVLILAQPTNV